MDRAEGFLIATTVILIFGLGFVVSVANNNYQITKERIIYINEDAYKCSKINYVDE